MASAQTKPPALLIWWIIWAAITVGLTVIYFTLHPSGAGGAAANLRYVPLLPLACAAVVRWFVLPRVAPRTRAFPFVIVGLALAEASGLLGLFLVPDLGPTYFVLSLLGLLQFAPFFATRHAE